MIIEFSLHPFREYSYPNQEGRGIPKRKRIKIKGHIDFDLDSWNTALKDSKLV